MPPFLVLSRSRGRLTIFKPSTEAEASVVLFDGTPLNGTAHFGDEPDERKVQQGEQEGHEVAPAAQMAIGDAPDCSGDNMVVTSGVVLEDGSVACTFTWSRQEAPDAKMVEAFHMPRHDEADDEAGDGSNAPALPPSLPAYMTRHYAAQASFFPFEGGLALNRPPVQLQSDYRPDMDAFENQEDLSSIGAPLHIAAVGSTHAPRILVVARCLFQRTAGGEEPLQEKFYDRSGSSQYALLYDGINGALLQVEELGHHKFLCPVDSLSSDTARFCTFRDEDAYVFELRVAAEGLCADIVSTFPALGYVQQGKPLRKAVMIAADCSNAVIAEHSRFVFAYSRPTEGAKLCSQHLVQLPVEETAKADDAMELELHGETVLGAQLEPGGEQTSLYVLTEDALVRCQLNRN